MVSVKTASRGGDDMEDEMATVTILDGRPGPSVQEVLAGDVNPAPAVMREESPAAGQSLEDVSVDRYISKAWHDREVEKVWRKTWQLACRVEEIPNVGDHVLYEIVHDALIVVRSSATDIKAYVNACLHRGTQLRKEAGSVKQFRCPFHGWTWSLDGRLTELPGGWDFPQVDREKACLPEARVGVWAGFVFVNFDPDCEPLETYLEILPEHFKTFALEDRYKAVHVAKIMPCNWKLAMEAFIEAYHVPLAHPQVLGYYGDENTQYDVYPGVRHVDRMISIQGVPSPSLPQLDPEVTIRHMRRDVPFFGAREIGEPRAAQDFTLVRQGYGQPFGHRGPRPHRILPLSQHGALGRPGPPHLLSLPAPRGRARAVHHGDHVPLLESSGRKPSRAGRHPLAGRG
jgi:phenylpropionate dioxygenase-like ring-hydroxylating dioxygenase large terminal subunit